MSVFKGHEDLSLNRYYYSFYSFSQSDPNTIKSFVYDQNQTLIFAKDISFNSRNVPAMLTFLENTQSNPYALGKSNDEYLNMDIAFAGVYQKALSQRQQQTLMTFVNNTYKNVYYGTVEKYIVTIGDNGGTPVVYFNGDTSDPNPLAIIHSNGLYIFDQSDPSNTNYQLEFRAIDTGNSYTTNVIIEGTPGTPNSYSVITVDNTTPTNLEYYINSTEPDVGTMKGDLYMGVYVVKTVENWASQTVFTIKAPFQDVYYDQPDLSFNSGDIAYFYVGDTTMTDFSLVFGPTVDSFNSNFYSSYVNKSGNVLTLDLTSYSGGPVYYFEDTSAGMGYVEASDPIIANNFSNTSQISAGSAIGNYNNRTWNQTQYGDFTDGTYNVITSTNVLSGHNYYLAEILLNESSDRATYYPLYNRYDYVQNNSGATANTTINTIVDGTNYYGAYAQVTMPYKLVLKEIYVRGRYFGTSWTYGREAMPKKVFIFGSNDNGTTLTFLKEDEIPYSSDLTNISSKAISGITEAYFTIRMVVNTLWTTSSGPTLELNHLRFIGDVLEELPPPKVVTVANGVFVIDGVSKDNITFTNGETYVFDQSDSTNAGFPIVFGETPESSTLYTTGVTVVGTPGQPGAYTKLVYNDTTGALYYYNNIIPGMGYAPNTISYYVTVAGTPPKFYLNSVQQPVSFTASTKYYFYQYDSTNENYQIVFGETIDTEPYFTDTNGVNTVGTPGQSGAYTILDLSDGFTGPLVYFSSMAPDMGFAAVYTVKVVQNWAGNNVFSIQAPNEEFSYNQPDLSFNAGDSALFDVGDNSMTEYSLVFGTEVDVSNTIIGSPYVSQSGTVINLNLPSDYTGGAVYYFEDTSAGMGYVEAPVTANVYPVTVSDGVVFVIDTGSGAQSKPQLTFTDGETYIFDQSDDSNTGYPIVFGTTADDMSTLYNTGVTVVGSPGQPGAYTRLDYAGSTTLYYFSSEATNMGFSFLATNYNITDGISFSGVTVTGTQNNRSWTQAGGTDSFTNGNYNVFYPSVSYYEEDAELLFDKNATTTRLALYSQNFYTSGSANTSGATSAVTNSSYYGHYVQLTMPYKLILKQIIIVGQTTAANSYDFRSRTPKKVYLFGSNNGGTTFTYLDTEDFPLPSDLVTNTSTISFTTITEGYSTIRMVVNSTQYTNSYGNTSGALAEWQLIGDVAPS